VKGRISLIKADAVNIRQVLHNLFKNALEAMGGKGDVTVKLESVQQYNSEFVRLAIYDTGCGIDIKQAKQIFEPYVTSKEKGTGLGLAIVKKVIEEMGGSIRLDSKYTQGAGFPIGSCTANNCCFKPAFSRSNICASIARSTTNNNLAKDKGFSKNS
jgi:C4-dicarboxylate-specific signal transduction histidine kinase